MFKCDHDDCEKEFEKEQALRMHKIGAHKKVQKKAKEIKPKTDQIPAHLTSEERAIAERVKSQDTDWFTIDEGDMNDFSLMVNPFDLLPEAAKLQNEKQYAFRYCERIPARIDELTRSVSPPLRWALVTRDSLPVMSKYVDDILGCVCKLDQALLFKPWAHHAMVKAAKQDLANVVDQTGSLKGAKHQIQSKGEDIEAFEGKEHKISSSDEVVADEAAMDQVLGVDEDRTELGDLVIE